VENAEGKRLIKWIEENKWEVLNGIKQGDEEGEWTYMDSRGGNSDTLRQNSERRSMGKSRRIQNKRESRVEPSRNSSEQPKGKEGTERERDEGWEWNLFLFYFLECFVLCM
jgi:hypothetical protein